MTKFFGLDRYNSEFWNQHEWFGGEETGILYDLCNI